MNLAVVGPLPPERSGIADYSAALLPYLRPYFGGVVAVTQSGSSCNAAPGGADAVYAASEVGGWQAGRAIPLYHMGCEPRYHGFVYELLVRYPGVTVLHDGNLLPFYNAVTLGRGDRAGFVREVSYVLERGDGHRRAWRALRIVQPLDPQETGMLERVARASLGVVVHSAYMRDRVLSAWDGAVVAVIPHLALGVGTSEAPSREAARTSLGLDPEDQILGVFGYIAPSKRVGSVLRAMGQLRPLFPRLRLICVGETVGDNGLQATIDDLHLADRVEITGYVSAERLQTYLSAIDVGVNLRQPTWGESSGTLARLLAMGTPVLVTDAGSFGDLPAGVVVKIPCGAGEVDAMVRELTQLLQDARLRERIGSAARCYMRDCCTPELVAQQFARFVRAAIE
ncbi:MAG: glycosyltransferase family 4 protein [Anaerolineae bacterium]|jgi:glycosyltransferase involved in cell wall biosynthesis|nr:glycosyltransferase family 4 protein [Anaerolineae bacterium]